MEDWIHINPTSGQGNDTVEITVDANTSSEDRSTTIDVKTSTLNKILSIIQKGIDMANVVLLDFGILSPKTSKSCENIYLNNSICDNYEKIETLLTRQNCYPFFFLRFEFQSSENTLVVPAYFCIDSENDYYLFGYFNFKNVEYTFNFSFGGLQPSITINDSTSAA